MAATTTTTTRKRYRLTPVYLCTDCGRIRANEFNIDMSFHMKGIILDPDLGWCDCETSGQLIEIDPGILPIVIAVREIGISTIFSCEGHIDACWGPTYKNDDDTYTCTDESYLGPYITFETDYKLNDDYDITPLEFISECSKIAKAIKLKNGKVPEFAGIVFKKFIDESRHIATIGCFIDEDEQKAKELKLKLSQIIFNKIVSEAAYSIKYTKKVGEKDGG